MADERPDRMGSGRSCDGPLLSETLAAKEAKAAGVHVTFTPMVDYVRDARWGRVMESTGEDTYLNSVLAKSFTNGFRKKGKTAICLKHFAAYLRMSSLLSRRHSSKISALRSLRFPICNKAYSRQQEQ